MTSTFIASATSGTPRSATAQASTAARDLRPEYRGARKRSRFPRPLGPEHSRTASESARQALWLGSDGPLRETAHDHATAAGLELVDARSAAPGAAAVQLVPAESLAATELPGDCAAELLVLTSSTTIDSELWRAALDHSARAVLRLPEESDALLTHLARAARPQRRSHVVGVVGGCGGAGASSLAARLAGALTRHGEVLLVDADPVGGGLDLLVETSQQPGITWQDAATVGSTDGEALCEALPIVDDVRMLVAGDGPGPDSAALQRVLHAVEPAGGTVVVDLCPALVPAAVGSLDDLLVVVPAHDHAVRAAARRLRAWSLPHGLAAAAVRRRGPLDPGEVASDLRLPLAMAFRDCPSGVVPLLDTRRRGADRACRAFAAELLSAAGADDRAGAPS